jgi:hypothetical protein
LAHASHRRLFHCSPCRIFGGEIERVNRYFSILKIIEIFYGANEISASLFAIAPARATEQRLADKSSASLVGLA